jgi:hypothetical protein
LIALQLERRLQLRRYFAGSIVLLGALAVSCGDNAEQAPAAS